MQTDIKKKVLQPIEATDNEELLQIIKADIEFFFHSTMDVTDDLSDEYRKELKRLAGEPDNADTISEDEFIKVTAKWRTK